MAQAPRVRGQQIVAIWRFFCLLAVTVATPPFTDSCLKSLGLFVCFPEDGVRAVCVDGSVSACSRTLRVLTAIFLPGLDRDDSKCTEKISDLGDTRGSL